MAERNLAADMAYRIGAIEHEITMLDLIRAEIKPVPEKGSPDGVDHVTFAICALRTAQDALKRISRDADKQAGELEQCS